MGKRSLKTSIRGQGKAKQALQRKGWTQDYLAIQAGLSTRNSVWKFVTGRPIERSIFMELCFQLDLDWQDLAELPQDLFEEPGEEGAVDDRRSEPRRPENHGSENHSSENQNSENQNSENQNSENQNSDDRSSEGQESRASGEILDVETLLPLARENLRGSIQAQCGTLELPFDGSLQLLRGEQLYISLNLLPRLSNQQWLEVSDLQRPEVGGDRLGMRSLSQSPNDATCEAMEVVARHSRVVILGKPGSGKTTFLKQIALQCYAGAFKPDCLALFIPLRMLASSLQESQGLRLLQYLNSTLNRFDLSTVQIKTLLEQGRFIFLLDGLDEIPQAEAQAVLQDIQQLAEIYYQNQIIITGRIAAQAYYFSGFTYVEMADFNEAQIAQFSERWFGAIPSLSPAEQRNKSAAFLEQLKAAHHQPIRELATTPLLLSLICAVFQERAKFPQKRSKLYQEGLEILLNRWDRSRGIQRDPIYSNLSLVEKLKLLSTIATNTFEQGHFFFEKSEVLQRIAEYLLTLPDTDTDPETLWLNSAAVLKTLEVQHGLLVERAKGIYSFSHLTFQEYLTARKIVASPNPETLAQSLKQLAERGTDPQWREVILLTVTMLPRADFLLQQLKEHIDRLLAQDEVLQNILHHLQQKAEAMESPYKTVAVRAFYFGVFHGRDLNLASALDPNLASTLSAELALDLALVRVLALSLSVSDRPDLERILELSFALDLEQKFHCAGTWIQALQALKNQLPTAIVGKANLIEWWRVNGRGWSEQLRRLMIEHRQWGHSWILSPSQQQRLQRYYTANQFLVECLQSQCTLTPSVREEIETTLLLPLSLTPLIPLG